MDQDIKNKYIKALSLMAIFNGAGGALFLVAFMLSKITVFLWAGLVILILTALVMGWFLIKIMRQ
jgi:hypothetical protein